MICRTLGQHYRCNASRFDVHLPKTGTLCRAGSVDCSLVVVDKGLYCIEPSADVTETHQTQEEDIHSAAAGWDHKLAVKSNGSLVTIGWNLYGQVQGLAGEAGSGPVYIHTWTPLSIKLGRDRVVSVAAGEKHSLLLTEGGSVWAWGNNAEGQLGSGALNDSCSPACVMGPGALTSEACRAIACGARHSCAISIRNELFCWGWSLHGQCAADMQILEKPSLVRPLVGLCMTGVAAGMAHTLALTDAGDVYSWGWNEDHQLGHEDSMNCFRPQLVEDIGQEDVIVVKVSCGARHSVVKTEDGRVFGCGSNKHAQLGQKSGQDSVVTFQEIQAVDSNEELIDVECGWWHTSLLLRSAALEPEQVNHFA